MARYDDINSKMVLYATITSCLLLFAVIQATQALTYYWKFKAETKTLDDSEYTLATKVIREQEDRLDGYQWFKLPPVEENGEPLKRLKIPIEQAKKIVEQEMRSQANAGI